MVLTTGRILGRNYWTSINDCPNPQHQGRSPSFYERGFDPIKPVDLIATLKLKGRLDKRPPEVGARLEYMSDMRTSVRDAVSEAEKNSSTYHDARKRHSATIKSDHWSV